MGIWPILACGHLSHIAHGVAGFCPLLCKVIHSLLLIFIHFFTHPLTLSFIKYLLIIYFMQGMHESLSAVSNSLRPHGILQARILEWGCHALLQGIFPIQGSNPGLWLCRWILYHLSHQGSPYVSLLGEIELCFIFANFPQISQLMVLVSKRKIQANCLSKQSR